MKAGFLARKAAKQTVTSEPANTVEKREQVAVPAADVKAAVTSEVPPGPAGPDTNPQQQASWQQCLELLRSEVDERKFVGLLLVTKLLPQATDTAIQEVLDAIGLRFIQRLLLPLKQTSQQPSNTDPDKLQQQHVSIVLGLSILSVTCRLPNVSSSDELLQLLPLLLKVAAAGGVGPVLQQLQLGPVAAQTQQKGAADWADTAAETAAVADALECVLVCISSGSYQKSVAMESNAFPLTVTALQAALRSLWTASLSSSSKSGAADASQSSATAEAASVLGAVMLCVQLLGVLLDQPGVAAAAVLQYPEAAAEAIMLLAKVFGEGLAAAGARGSSSSSTRVDPAAIQLQAQHTLLLLLRMSDNSQAAALLRQAAAAAADPEMQHIQQQSVHAQTGLVAAAAVAGDWPAALRHGLSQLLRSRTGVVQRHSALQLAAAVADLLGDGWLLPLLSQQQHGPTPSSNKHSADQFLLVLMEVLAIETPLLLSDAMNPEAVIPRADIGMTARSPAAAADIQQPPPPAAAADADMDVDSDSSERGGGDDAAQPEQQALSVQQILQQVQQQEARASSSSAMGKQQQQQGSASSSEGPPGFKVLTPEQQKEAKSLQQQLAELQLPDEKPAGPEQQAAGARAQQLLPACFQLLECCCEVLVQQATLLEQLADMDDDGTGQQAMTTVLPVLQMKEVEQLMMRMQQVTEVLLEFIDFATSEPGITTVNPLLTAGAVRVLGRFLADAPDAHQESVQKLLPRLLAVTVPGEPLTSGVSFLLPALLSWTSSSNSSQQQWVNALLATDDKCLGALSQYTSLLADRAAALAGSAVAGGASSTSSTDLEELATLEAQLGTACRVLQQLLARLPVNLARYQGTQKHQKQQQPSSQTLSLSASQMQLLSCPAVESLVKWGQARHRQQQSDTGSPGMSPVGAAVAFLHSMQQAQLSMSVLLSVAALSGQLLMVMSAHTPGSRDRDSAAAGAWGALGQEAAVGSEKLLCWGCEAGWAYQLLQAWQGSDQAREKSSAQNQTLGHDSIEQLQAWVGSSWVDAELEELWNVCLTTAAELVLADCPTGLPDAFRSAAWVAAATQSSADEASTAAAATAVQDSMELQLLIQALQTRNGGM